MKTKQEMAAIAEKARAVIAAGPPAVPARFGAGTTGLGSRAELWDLVELTSHAVQGAAGRVSEATLRGDEYAVTAINIAALEAATWLRALDDLMQRVVWDTQLTASVRERTSREVDRRVAGGSVADAVRTELASTRNAGEPCTYWTQALLAKGAWLPRDQLSAFRWLAGKLLHHGPLSVVELHHWRVGGKPHWVWRTADAIFPPSFEEERPKQRAAYENRLTGRDVMGSLNLTGVLIEMEFLFCRLLRESEDEGTNQR